MSNLKPEATNSSLRVRDKFFIGLGMTMVAVSTIIWLLTIGLAPELTKPSWDIADPGLTLFALIVGLCLVLSGAKKLIKASVSRLDGTFEQFIVYRGTRWIVMKAALLVLLILDFILSVIADEPRQRHDQNSPITPSNPRHDAWDVASNHYYDKEPPPPFLKDDNG